MPRKGHSEGEIMGVLRKVEGGQQPAGVCRQHGISQGTLHVWKERPSDRRATKLSHMHRASVRYRSVRAS